MPSLVKQLCLERKSFSLKLCFSFAVPSSENLRRLFWIRSIHLWTDEELKSEVIELPNVSYVFLLFQKRHWMGANGFHHLGKLFTKIEDFSAFWSKNSICSWEKLLIQVAWVTCQILITAQFVMQKTGYNLNDSHHAIGKSMCYIHASGNQAAAEASKWDAIGQLE